MSNTEVRYMYRDSSNYKLTRSVVLEGALTEVERQTVDAALEEREYFLPAQVGLDVLYTEWSSHFDDDHPWHELCEISTTSRPAFHHEAAHQFAARFTGIDWDIAAARADLAAWLEATPEGR